MSATNQTEVALLFKFVTLGPLWVLRDIEMSTLPPAPFRDDETVVIVAHIRGRNVDDAVARMNTLIDNATDLTKICNAFEVRYGGTRTAARALRLLALAFLADQIKRFKAAANPNF